VRILKSGIEELIRHYVRESGVRTLQRRIGSIFRKIAREAADGKEGPWRITKKDIVKYLGPRKHNHELANRKRR